MARVRVLFAALLAASVLLSLVPAASASPSLPNPFGGGLPQLYGQVAPDGDLVNLVWQGLLGYEELPTSGGHVYSDQLAIQVYDPSYYGRDLTIATEQYVPVIRSYNNTTVTLRTDQIWSNSTFSVAGRQVTAFTFSLPSSAQLRDVLLLVDGVAWTFSHQTLPSYLPAVVTQGAMDAVAASELLLFGIGGGIALGAARSTQRRGQRWAPKPHLLRWIVVGSVLGAFLGLELFPQVDALAGQGMYLLYPVPFAFGLYFWSLHLFNGSPVAEILRPEFGSGYRTRFHRWERRILELADGSLVVVYETWRGWLYGLFGHYARLPPVSDEEGPPYGAAVQNHRYRLRFAPSPGREQPWQDFPVAGADAFAAELPERIWWVDSDRPVEIQYPRLSVHREVSAEEDSPQKTRKLTWPHIVDGTCQVRFAGVHWTDATKVALGWQSAESVARSLEAARVKLHVALSELRSEADRQAEERVQVLARLLARPVRGRSREELEAEVRAWKERFYAKDQGRAVAPSLKD